MAAIVTTSLLQSFTSNKLITLSHLPISNTVGNGLVGASMTMTWSSAATTKKRTTSGRVDASATSTTIVAAPVTVEEEVKEYALPSWAKFEIGKAPVYWKTTNGLPPSSGELLKLFYNPDAKKLTPNEEFGIAFNVLHAAVNLIFSFTNGVDWDGPYRLQFQVPKAWRNKPIEFFNEGLGRELSQEGACDRAIFPDTEIIPTRCAMVGNLSTEGGDRCDLDLVPGCMDTSSHLFNPLANVDDGSCPIDLDIEDE
ncbi:hypothetical protein LINPERPRIM_LOCUS35168 [Linum perenne]